MSSKRDIGPRAGLAAAALVIMTLSGCASAPQPPETVLAPGQPVQAAPAPAPTRDSTFLPIRYDATTGKVFLTVPRPGEPLLYLNTLATGLGSPAASLDRGEVGISALVRFERRGPRMLLIQENTTTRAITENAAARRAVEESFPSSVLASFAVQSEGPAGVVVDATSFLLSDVFDVVGRIRSAQLGTVRLDADRSFIDPQNTGAFPTNTEVRSVLSYVTDAPHPAIRALAPDGRSITLAQQHSFVRLPASPLPMREFDPRAGLFTTSFFDFAQGFDSDYRQRAVARWRLEPRDPEAYARGELVEPVEPIIYYLDPAIPEPYRTAFIEGGMWWNQIFQAAGWRNAFRVEPLPAGVSPLDARYPMIYWVHRQQRGPSVGPSQVDPRSGEIITTVVRMDSYRSLVDHDIYMGFVPAAGDRPLELSAEQLAMARRRQHMAHEIGHTLGIAHNFIASAQGRASVMDYPYPLVDVDSAGRITIADAYRNSGGAHDTLAIRYAYTWFRTPAEEKAKLKEIVREGEARGLRFIGDAHAGLAGSYPAATLWVEGSNMLDALRRTMAVRRVLIDRFDERAAQPGEPLAVLNRRFAHVYLHHRYALHGAIKYVGGMEFGYALRGEETDPTSVLPPQEQRQALRLVLANLEPAALRIPERVTALIPPVPSGYDNDLTLIPTPAGTAFDPIATAHSLAQEIVDGLLHPERAARLVSFNARNASSPSLSEVLAALDSATWGAATSAQRADPQEAALRRVTQRAVLDGLLDLAGSSSATAPVRAAVEHRLGRLQERLGRGAGSSAEEQGHRAAALRDIERYFAGRDDRARRPRPAPIPLPWP